MTFWDGEKVTLSGVTVSDLHLGDQKVTWKTFTLWTQLGRMSWFKMDQLDSLPNCSFRLTLSTIPPRKVMFDSEIASKRNLERKSTLGHHKQKIGHCSFNRKALQLFVSDCKLAIAPSYQLEYNSITTDLDDITNHWDVLESNIKKYKSSSTLQRLRCLEGYFGAVNIICKWYS